MKLQLQCRLPNSAFVGGKRTNQLRAGMSTCRYAIDTNKPDLDNLVKFVMDALQVIIYKDDKQVVNLVSRKSWDLSWPYEGRTVIKVRNAHPTDIPHNTNAPAPARAGII